MPSLPYSSKKRYLTGIDWVITALDNINKTKTSIGNHSLVVLDLEGSLSPSLFESRVQLFFKDNSVLKGSLKRDKLNLAPYWKIDSDREFKYSFTNKEFVANQSLDDVLQVFSEFANTEFTSKHEYISFLLYELPGKTYLGLKFDHKILDARGAEALLDYLNQYSDDDAYDFNYPQEPYLRDWHKKFNAGKVINRFLRSMDTGQKRNSLSLSHECIGPYNQIVEVFNPDETKYILESANKKAGYLMTLPYLLARTLQAVDMEVFADENKKSMYLIPVNMDRRGRTVKRENVFFNQLSFFYFSLDKELLADEQETFKSLRLQWYDQMKNKIPEAFELANRLSRILPLKKLSNIMLKQFIKHPAAFSFSYVGEEGYSKDDFMGLKIHDIYHMPIVPVYPGFGIFFTKFRGSLKLVISALDSQMPKKSIESLTKNIKQRLLLGYEL